MFERYDIISHQRVTFLWWISSFLSQEVNPFVKCRKKKSLAIRHVVHNFFYKLSVLFVLFWSTVYNKKNIDVYVFMIRVLCIWNPVGAQSSKKLTRSLNHLPIYFLEWDLSIIVCSHQTYLPFLTNKQFLYTKHINSKCISL